MKFNKLIFITLLLIGLTNSSLAISSGHQSTREINELKKKITKMQGVNSEAGLINEKYYKHKLALAQVKTVKKVAAYETYMFLAKAGTRRSLVEINKIVDVAWECSWIFTDLGANHMERFKRILEWCKGETNFKANELSRWKKGQYIKSLNVTIKNDTADYGAWQINDANMEYAKGVYRLYKSGVIPFKIIKIRKMEDLFDIPTNCVVRCAIETDRKASGMEWRHHARPNDREYLVYLSKKLKELEKENMYDEALISNYYKLIPVKRYFDKTPTNGEK
jgi:hypothetical protein